MRDLEGNEEDVSEEPIYNDRTQAGWLRGTNKVQRVRHWFLIEITSCTKLEG